MNLTKLKAIKLRDLNDFDPANPPGPAQDILVWRDYLGDTAPLAYLFRIVDHTDSEPDEIWNDDQWVARIWDIWEYFD